MPCLYPVPATRRNVVHLGDDGTPRTTQSVDLWPKGERREDDPLTIPCGNCLECRDQDRLSWALRCWLEWQEHQDGIFATLTYKDAPLQLQATDLQRFHKRLRKELTKQGRKLRYFAAGEYGDQNSRPHYHGLYFGLTEKDNALIAQEWGHGFVRTDPINIARIHYIVGYTDKKRHDTPPEEWQHFFGYAEQLDRNTGEITKVIHKNYYVQPPFRVMSKNPGLGAVGKQWRNAWRTHAVLEGRTIAVPRFLKQHWKDTATKEELETRELQLQQQRQQRARTTETPRTWEEEVRERDREREAKEEIHRAKNKARRTRRD